MNTSPVLQSVAAPNPRFIHRLAHTWKSCAHTRHTPTFQKTTLLTFTLSQ